jgi:ubiquitin carboxyl-terminal hydrolase 5/13
LPYTFFASSKKKYSSNSLECKANEKRGFQWFLIKGVEARPLKMTKLSIQETLPDEFDFKTKLSCLECGDLEQGQIEKFDLGKNADAIMNAVSAKKKDELKAWEEESVQSCYHTLELVQTGEKIQGRSLGHCKDCDLKDNLWLCLTCGNLGCGRAQYGGLGGNGHGLKHFESCKHPVAVKMGSITPEGTAGKEFN